MNGFKPCIQIINLQLDLFGKPVYRNLNLQINCGTLTALVGQNPAAWNTLLRLLSGMQPVHSGQIELWNTPISRIGRRNVNNLICFIPRQHQPVFAYTVMEFIMQGCEASLKPLQTPQESDRERAKQIMRNLKIEKLANRDSSLLNNSERQLVLLARAFMQDAKLYLLDDPFNSLNEAAQFSAMTLLREMVHENDRTALVAMQDPWLAMQLADQLVVFNQQGIAAVLYRQQPDFADAAEYVLHQVLDLDESGHLLDLVNPMAGLGGSLPLDKESEKGKTAKDGFLF